MNTPINKIFTVAFCLFSLLACQRIEEISPEVYESNDNIWTVTIDADKGVDETKALTLSGNKISATWEVGDIVRVVGKDGYIGDLTATSSGKTTKLTGTLSGELELGDDLGLYYCCETYSGQDGTLEYISNYCDYSTAYVQIIGLNNGSVTTSSATFESQQSINKMTFVDDSNNVLTPTTVLIRYIVDGDNTIYPLTGRYTSGFSITSNRFTQSYAYGSLIINNVNNQQSIYIALPWVNNKKLGYYFVVYAGNQVYIGEKAGTILKGNYYTTTVRVYPYVPEYVDMGLSVKWSTCNLGAYYAQAVGDYYAWGEITPKTEYDLTNYRFGNWNSETGLNPTKYNNTDHLLLLEMEDDAAHQRLGAGWWMPTKSNWEELLDENNCTFSQYYSGDPFVIVTSKITGNYIYLPLAGCVDTNILFSGGLLSDLDLYFYQDFIRDESSGLFKGEAEYWSSNRTADSVLSSSGEAFFWHPTVLTSPGGSVISAYGSVDNHVLRSEGLQIRPVYIEPVRAAVFDQPSVTLSCLDYSEQLYYSVTPSDGTARTIRWESSDPSIVAVDQSGKVTSVKRGTATITVVFDEDVSASCQVTVNQSDESFLRYKENYSDQSYTNSHDSSRDRYYASCLPGFENASVIKAKIKLNEPGTGYLGSGNLYDDEAFIRISKNSKTNQYFISCMDDAENTFSFPLSDYNIVGTDLMIIEYNGINHTFTVNGHTVECNNLTTFSFDYVLAGLYDDTADSGSDDDDEIAYYAIPNDSKVYYIQAYNSSNSRIKTGARSSSKQKNSSNGNASEYCWIWTNSNGTTTNVFATYPRYSSTGTMPNNYEPYGNQ